jgi:hypothetical protein
MMFDQHLRDGFLFGRYLVWEYDLVKYVESPEQSRSGRFRRVTVSMVNAGTDHPADGVVCDSSGSRGRRAISGGVGIAGPGLEGSTEARRCPRGLRPSSKKADPNYLPADLCLADLCAIEQRWQDMLRFANASIAIDPANNFHAYFYAAGAYYGLHQLPEAETNALKAAEIDQDQREPRTPLFAGSNL